MRDPSRRRRRRVFVPEVVLRRVVVAAIVLAMSGCRHDASVSDADASTDAARPADGDARIVPDSLDAPMDSGTADVTAPRWECPLDWVPFARGGCGPAVILCGPEGGALAVACNGLDVHRPRTLVGSDGGAVTSFFVQSDGGLGGGWNAPAPGSDAGRECPDGIPGQPDGTCGAVVRTDCPAGTGALPDGTCTATDDSVCPGGAFADPGPEATGAQVVHVTAGADAASADGSLAHPFATLAAAIAHAVPGAWVLVGHGSFPEAVTAARDVHVLGRCAVQTILAATGSDPTFRATAHARVDLRGVTIGGAGGAVTVDTGAQLTLSSTRVLAALGHGVLVTDTASVVSARDVLVEGTRAVLGGEAGVGVSVRAGASLVGARVAYVSNHGGLVVQDPGSSASLLDVLVHDSLQRFDGADAAGIAAFAGGRVMARRIVISSSRGFGVVADQAGSEIDLIDAAVTDSLPLSSEAPGAGVQARSGAGITLMRTVVTGNRGVGVSSSGLGSSVQVTDSSVTDTLPTIAGIRGYGLEAIGGAALRADRTVVTRATEAGVFIGTGATATLGDVLVSATRPSIQGFGLGVVSGAGTRIDAQRLAVTHVRGVGLAAVSTGTTLPGMGGVFNARHVFVRNVQEGYVQLARYGPPAPTGTAVAYGLSSTSGSSGHVSFAVLADGVIGLFDRSAMLSLENAVITGQQLGAALGSTAATSQPTFYDVVFLGNDADGPSVDTTLPEPFSMP